MRRSVRSQGLKRNASLNGSMQLDDAIQELPHALLDEPIRIQKKIRKIIDENKDEVANNKKGDFVPIGNGLIVPCPNNLEQDAAVTNDRTNSLRVNEENKMCCIIPFNDNSHIALEMTSSYIEASWVEVDEA